MTSTSSNIILLEQVEIGSNIVVKLIEKGATTLQLRSTKPHEHESTCSGTMVTCDMPLSKGNILWSFCIKETNKCLYRR
jgi:hypothetical protein